MEVFRGFSSSPLLPLKHFATRQRRIIRNGCPRGTASTGERQVSLGKTSSPGRGGATSRGILDRIGIAWLIDVHQSFEAMSEMGPEAEVAVLHSIPPSARFWALTNRGSPLICVACPKIIPLLPAPRMNGQISAAIGGGLACIRRHSAEWCPLRRATVAADTSGLCPLAFGAIARGSGFGVVS